MAISIAQYVDLLFKKLQGVAKTANASTKSASNESIASPAFIRGDVVWTQSDQIPSTAQAIANISLALIGANSVQCAADTTVPPIGGIRPTWLTNTTYWVPQEFGATWLPKVYVGPSGAANIEATGTQIFSAGSSGTGEYYFDTQAGVLNFIGETIPAVLTAGNVVYVSGYQYVGDLGVTNLPSGTNIGNLQINGNTITATVGNTVTIGNSLSVLGNVTATTFIGNVSGNITGNVSAGGANTQIQFNDNNLLAGSAAFTFDKSSNAVIANGNITGANFLSSGLISVAGNITGNNVVVGNILIPSTGNVLLGNVNINNLAGPVANSDAATKFYVDSVAANVLPIITNQTITPNGSANTFGLDQSTTAVGVLVTINGVTQTPTVDYTVTGNSITIGETPLNTDIIQVRYLSGTQTGGGGTNYANANVVAYAESGWAGNIIPQGNLVYNLGNSTNRWNDLYLSGNTIYLDAATIGATGTSVTFSGNVTGAYIKGNGSELTNLPAPAVAQDITSVGDMSIMLYDGTIKYNNYATVEPASGDIKSAGKISAVGNITGGNILTAGIVSATGNITAGNVSVGGNLSVTGNIIGNVVTRFESTWTVPVGNSTQSFTMTPNNTYYMWVECNIPNGIIVWNATATITNTNVPVVGAQYAWVYNGGGTPIDFTSIPNQFVGTANTIVRSSVAPSATTNRFDFGINNASGGNVTVRYGWARIS